jgi:phosphinothricin acetyltransferase
MRIRPATSSDLPATLAIYNREILTSTTIYIDEPQTLEQHHRWFASKHEAKMPVFVLEDDDGVAGFATYGQFRNLPGYRFCIEHSIYVAESKRRLGHGKRLLACLIEAAGSQGMHTMIAAIDAGNETSIKLHTEAGFVQVALFKEIGCKFNHWLDVVFLQKMLDNRTLPTP